MGPSRNALSEFSIRRWRFRRRKKEPSPVSFVSSGEYEGNDGPWSTFALRIGTPPQLLQLLVSTTSPEAWVVTSEGCSAKGDDADCGVDRGKLFNSANSDSWRDWKNQTVFPLDNERNFPYHGDGRYGQDDIAIGWGEGTVLPHQNIAQIATKDYYLGSFGVSPRQLSPLKQGEGRKSNLETLKDEGVIPSLAYGYTAGARYRRKGPETQRAEASLTLGGYDASLMEPNDFDFRMLDRESQDLSVNVQSIGVTKPGELVMEQIHATPFRAKVDSSVSEYWLPQEAISAFETAFGLQYNETIGLYLNNKTQHDELRTNEANVTFVLSDAASSATSAPGIELVFPYRSFAMRVNENYPNGPYWSWYFPIRASPDPAQWTLGRAFLQETYLIANYERGNFSLNQRLFVPDSTKPAIVPILDPRAPARATPLPTATLFGIIIGGALLSLALISLIIWHTSARRRKKLKAAGLAGTTLSSELDSTARIVYELDKSGEVHELPNRSSRVEMPNPDIKAYHPAASELPPPTGSPDGDDRGPFELPAEAAFATPERSPTDSVFMAASLPTDSMYVSPLEDEGGRNTLPPMTGSVVSPLDESSLPRTEEEVLPVYQPPLRRSEESSGLAKRPREYV